MQVNHLETPTQQSAFICNADGKHFAYNNNGQLYAVGVADPAKWLQIQELHKKYPDKRMRWLSKEAKCSVSTVHKALHQEQPKKHGTGVHEHTFDSTLVQLGNHYLGLEGSKVDDLPYIYENCLGENFHRSTYYRHLDKDFKASRQKGIYEDPRKWLPRNAFYYGDFLTYQYSLTDEEAFSVKTFDECRVDLTSMITNIYTLPP